MSERNERNEYLVVMITAGSAMEAETLSRGLVESKLAFCVNVVPSIQSTYYWEGDIHVDAESLLIVKTRADRFDALERWVRENHGYDVPEVIALPIVKGSSPYLKGIDDWLDG